VYLQRFAAAGGFAVASHAGDAGEYRAIFAERCAVSGSFRGCLQPRSHQRRRSRAPEVLMRGRTRRPGLEELFLAVDERVDVVGREFDAVAVGDGVRGARLDAISAEDAARVVDVVDACVALAGGDALRLRIFRSFDVDTIRGARGGAQEAPDALLVAIFVPLKYVNSPIARLDARSHLREALRGGLPKHRAEGDAEALDERCEGFPHFSDDRWHRKPL